MQLGQGLVSRKPLPLAELSCLGRAEEGLHGRTPLLLACLLQCPLAPRHFLLATRAQAKRGRCVVRHVGAGQAKLQFRTPSHEPGSLDATFGGSPEYTPGSSGCPDPTSGYPPKKDLRRRDGNLVAASTYRLVPCICWPGFVFAALLPQLSVISLVSLLS